MLCQNKVKTHLSRGSVKQFWWLVARMFKFGIEKTAAQT